MLRFFYSLLWYLALPMVLLRLWRRGSKAPEYRRHIGQRFGFVPRHSNAPLWIHAVSVGETVAIAPLVELLLQRHPDLPLLLTNMTPTGAARAQALFGNRVAHCYCPYDLPDAMGRFMDRVRPRGLLIVETELWPNMLFACKKSQVSVLLANARLSERSAQGYARFAGLTRQMLSALTRVAAQHQADASRLVALGLLSERVAVTGSIKFDLDIAHDLPERAEQLRALWGAGRPVIVAGSTHEGEERLLLESLQLLHKAFPTLLLVLVPRHPERFESVATLVNATGLCLSRRSQGQPVSEDTAVYLADTMGEMMLFYQAADLVFVGGSLIERGGHNPLEPAALGKPVLMGPHCFNFQSITQMLAEAGGLIPVADVDELTRQLGLWLEQPALAKQVGQAGAAFVAQNKGALERLYLLVLEAMLKDQS
ncbi:lipid IV(A) 3-deoxy-D-manno-octulosonic acid transferase [Neptuniibacter sp. CAU 1671]|uniref:lipid IV(A) 3-deoxy-D-manno-octulosonic acid transferase n=1 Tax=Neptuniibacter sp. CAU 1671 TaxID=3032593 RepID=UPI0023DAA838|nr:lipid IV(A) 3-deoxy-D-manno-octulosonic acid transferase [Neptuniibacter sp. CAU 1671]MDF2182406.1 lipid IV(A) 3-deoxy-D-manno-octulosonic acid transferase [Neptuniibacter sp. CAU 1671]